MSVVSRREFLATSAAAGAAGLPVPTGVQGRSFLKLARTGDATWKNTAFSQLRGGMYLEGPWKLIDNSLEGSEPFELYHLASDPKEERNLAEKEPGRVSAMKQRLAEWRAEKPAPARVTGMATPAYAQISEAPDEGDVERLQLRKK